MKKIVGIIAALAIAGSAFALPDVTPVASMGGNAKLEYIIDLDGEAMGMHNAEEATFKIQFVAEGTRETEGDGLWGELKVKAGKQDPESKYTKDNCVETKDEKSGVTVTVPSVEAAKIHFIDGDTFLHVDIRHPGLSLGDGDIALATSSPWKEPKVGVVLDGAQGFKVQFGIPAVAVNFTFADNGVVKSSAKEFGFVLDATLKGEAFDVEGLAITAGFGYSTQKIAGKSQDAALFAKATYKLSLDDPYYVQPTVAFGLQGKAKQLVAGVLFGWGGTGVEAKFDGFSNGVKNVPDKCSNGVSIALKSSLENKAPMEFLLGFYDAELLKDFGLTIGAQLAVADLAHFGKGSDAFDAAVKYSSGDLFGDWKLSANLGIKFLIDPSKFGALYGFKIENGAIIQNTSIYAEYKGEHAADIGGADLKGKLTIGTKISF